MAINRTPHAVYHIQYHFVWRPKYRKGLLTSARRAYLLYLLKRIAREYGLKVVEVEVMPDHVHLFISGPPRYSPAELMQIIKSITAREMFKKFPTLRQSLWAGEFWGPGYYVGTAGDDVTTDMIKRYIRQQLDDTTDV
jgi:putative transposase